MGAAPPVTTHSLCYPHALSGYLLLLENHPTNKLKCIMLETWPKASDLEDKDYAQAADVCLLSSLGHQRPRWRPPQENALPGGARGQGGEERFSLTHRLRVGSHPAPHLMLSISHHWEHRAAW